MAESSLTPSRGRREGAMTQDEEKAFSKLVGIWLRWARRKLASRLPNWVKSLVSERQYRRYEAGSSTLYLEPLLLICQRLQMSPNFFAGINH